MIYNRIQVAFGALKRITGPTISYQYDVQQILVINGLNLPEYYVVDFCNEGDATVIPMTGTSDGVEIPDSLLQTGKPVKAYIVVSSGQGDVQTRYEVKLPVNNRPMRDDIHPTDPQQQQIDALVDALNDGVSRAETAADETIEAIESFKNPTASAETLEPDKEATASYDDGHFTFGIPKGDKGDPFTYGDFTEEEKQELIQGPILDAQNSAVSAVNLAGTTQVGNVNQAGATQVGNVNTAGATQVQAVEDKGEETLESIPEDYTILSYKINSMKFADGCLISAFFDTEPNITDYNKAQNDGAVVNKNGACLAVFDVTPGHTYKIFRSNATGYSFSGSYTTHLLIDGEYYGYSNSINTQNTIQTFTFNNTQISAGVNQLRLVLVMAEVEDSYVYDGTTGEVCFAGKNTVYYGKKYIDGHVTDAVVLTDKNLDEVKPGIIIAKDGKVHFGVQETAVDSNGIRFAEGAIESAVYGNGPIISDYNKAQYDGAVIVKNGACLAIIDVDPTHQYTIYRKNSTGFSFGGATALHKLKDGEYIGYSNGVGTFNSEVTQVFSDSDRASEINQIRLGFVTAEIDDSYIIDKTTGEICLAGKNTQYYGKRYTDGRIKDATLLSNKNLDSLNLGLIIGTDGKAHLSIDEIAIDGEGIKFAENAIEEALYETKPRIAEYGVRGYGDSYREQYAPTCLTEKYKLLNGKTRLMVYQALASGTSISWNGANVISFYNGDTYLGYTSITGNMNEEHLINPASVLVEAGIDSFFVPLVTASISDSYVYDPDTGYIYFAGENTPYYGLKTIYDANTQVGLAAVFREIDEDIEVLRNDNHDMIPLFLTTDQHRTSIEVAINTFLKTASISKLSKILNLGDTVADHWIVDDEDHPYMYTHELDAYAEQVKNIPDEKRLDVFGNHDTWGVTPLTTPQNRLYKYFYNKQARYFDNHGNFTIIDDYYNIKYLVIGGYEYTGPDSQYTHYEISSKALDWMISEMESDDGYDIIILSHQPLGANGTSYHNPVNNTDFTVQSIAAHDYSSLWVARKNKTAGTITDEYGVVHSYDFTACRSNLICGLHGHEHKDGICYISNALCDLIFQCYSKSNNETVCYYLLIDRENNQANIWRIDTTANTYTNYQLPFEPQTP